MHIVHICIAYHKSMQIKCQGNIDPTCRLTCKCVFNLWSWTLVNLLNWHEHTSEKEKENMRFRRNKDEKKNIWMNPYCLREIHVKHSINATINVFFYILPKVWKVMKVTYCSMQCWGCWYLHTRPMYVCNAINTATLPLYTMSLK